MKPGPNGEMPGHRDRRGRQILTVAALAARLEHRLHEPEIGRRELVAGCALAAKSGLAAVLCRPEHVLLAAKELAGTPVDVVTALGFHQAGTPPTTTELAQEAADLTSLGATEVALIAHPHSEAATELLAENTVAVSEAIRPVKGRVRVLLNTTDMTDDQVSAFCQAMVHAGAALIQGGSYHGDRTGFSHIEIMRAAIAPPTLLKWTHPVRSIQTMLVSIAVGVDRFNGNPATPLKDAAQAITTAPLTVPIPGLDF